MKPVIKYTATFYMEAALADAWQVRRILQIIMEFNINRQRGCRDDQTARFFCQSRTVRRL